ncbi:dermatan-sulfate epimerase-like protein [Dendronephthya gigantea]|uniref:dermatan-sulfate epimerase-like protein n=1 Tax=Dendronephthya gigantea TaxID=151771 RepID=UPI00106C3916|nr:dermatan-sulfate epimerase-like protein [Dendronephthya gigantea]
MSIFFVLLQILVLHATALRGETEARNERRSAVNAKIHKYPNLYFSAEDLPKLRAQAISGNADIYKELTDTVRKIRTLKKLIPPANVTVFTAQWNEKYGNMLGILAFYCALTPEDRASRDLAKLFMTRFTGYNTWLVTGKEKDEVPLAHSLLGYATAFDMLHDSFTQQERDRYANTLLQKGTQMFKAANRAWWGRSYIHNHVATNYMALLTAALVVKPYHPKSALEWQEKSIFMLNATMEFLKLVVDGSFQEGVSYGSYTMRSLTQFMFLSERHFALNYRGNNWLLEHFDFLLYTIMPGFQRTVGFADSNMDWAYGPESQLVFLETYVLQDGRARWLSKVIKKRKLKGILSVDRKSLVHTELLFSNSSKTKRSSDVKLHVFSDWGVVTYGGGILEPRLFLSLKCGHLHGRAINQLRPSLDIALQRGFVPGHEQPDQGSFVFVTEDQAVVTESRYGPKFTYLQNTLMFGPSTKGCSKPYLGQLGECSMWFNHKFDARTWTARADLVGYSRENDVVFMSGELTQVYDEDLGLSNVYRVLVTLSPSVLVLVDIVRFRARSATTHASAFFHNSDFAFNTEDYDSTKNRCAGIGRYRMCWEHLNAATVDVSTKNNFKLQHQRFATNFINHTWQRSSYFTSTAYIFHGPNDKLKGLKVAEMNSSGIRISIKLNSTKYDVILSTRYDNPRTRRRLLGSNGYGKVHISSTTKESTVHLGVKTPRHAYNVSTLPSQTPPNDSLYGFYCIIICAVMLLICLDLKRRLRFRQRIIAACVLSICLTVLYVYTPGFFTSFGSFRSPPYSTSSFLPTLKNNHRMNAVLITGLPSSGVEIARELFTTNRDFITIGVPSQSRIHGDADENVDLSEWTKVDVSDQNVAKWWNTLLNSPTAFREERNDYISLVNPLDSSAVLGTTIRKSESAFAAVSFRNPSWLFRISVLFRKASSLYIVRDPRSWIDQLLSRPVVVNSFLKEFESALRKTGSTFPPEIEVLRKLSFSSLKQHIALAHIWSAFAEYALRLESTLPPGALQIVRFEDIVTSPRATADGVYGFLEMPLPAAVEHRIVQVTKTRLYKFVNYGIIGTSLLKWGKVLTKQQISEISTICEKVMKNTGYEL